MRRNFTNSNLRKNKGKIVGEIRQSQLITSFGCGAIVDFLHDTVIIAGTDLWNWGRETIDNKHIIYNENLQSLLDKSYFVKPKTTNSDDSVYGNSRDIPAYRFPKTMYCTYCKRLMDYNLVNSRSKYSKKCPYCNKRSIVPSRFIAVCEKGHVEEFPYNEWVHNGRKCKKSNNPELKLINVGGKSSIDSLYVKCETCGAIRGMKSALYEQALKNIKACSANEPWLPKNTSDKCEMVLKTRLRASTNVYFPIVICALSIPPWSRRIYSEINKNYDALDDILSLVSLDNEHNYKSVLSKSRVINKILYRLSDVKIEELVSCFNKLKSNKLGPKKTNQDIYEDEYRVLLNKQLSDDEYSACTVKVPEKYKYIIDKVVAIDKLTEVKAMYGFTRIKPWSRDLYDDRIAKISSENRKWLPAVKLKGEGIFIAFNIDKINKWSNDNEQHYIFMKNNLEKSYLFNERYSPAYVFLHTFSHLLIRELSSMCGYSTASIKEKIYSTFTYSKKSLPMAGILIYTASPDSDGSLGGLVELADNIKLEEIIDRMIEKASWCSLDPTCIKAYGEYAKGVHSMNYAACHACSFLPETSCEFRNLLLDRASIIGLKDENMKGLLFYE